MHCCRESVRQTAMQHTIGRTDRGGRIAETVEEQAGTKTINLLPVAGGGTSGKRNGHPATTPTTWQHGASRIFRHRAACCSIFFAGSGTMLAVGLDLGASQAIRIERQKKYIRIAQKRIVQG